LLGGGGDLSIGERRDRASGVTVRGWRWERERKMRTRLLAAGIAKRIKTRGNRQMSLGQSPAGPVRGAKEELRPWDPWAGCVAGARRPTRPYLAVICVRVWQARHAETVSGGGRGAEDCYCCWTKKLYSRNDNNIIYYNPRGWKKNMILLHISGLNKQHDD